MSGGNQTPVNMPSPVFRGGNAQRLLRPVEKPRNARKAFFGMLSFFRDVRIYILVTFVLVLISSMTALISPYLLGRAIDRLDLLSVGIPESDVMLKGIIYSLTAIYVSDAASRFFQSFLMAGVSQRIVKSMRQTLFSHMQKLPLSYFDSYTHGELMSRLSNDTDNISSVLGTAITQLMSLAITLTGTFVMMLILSPVMTFFSLVTMPLVYLLTKVISSGTRKCFREQQALLGQLNSHIEESISGIGTVKAYSRERKSIEHFDDINGQLRKISTRAQILSGYIMPIMNVINNLSFTIVAGAGSVLAVKGMISVGAIVSFISYSRQFGRPLNEFAGTYNTFQSALASAERVFDILDTLPEEADKRNAKELKNTKGRVTFAGVGFGYVEAEPVLKDVSFDVRSGETIALVGPTGAGKTTVVNLLTRFYDTTEGSISIDGIDIRDYTRDSLRKTFGIVLQDTYLFSGTISENIKYGRPDATDAEIENAAKASGAEKFIRRLPDGYETVLTESGRNLSGGQKQLLAIARVILANPPILILDEATSNVDTGTELRIQEAMVRLMNGRTSFIIAHRLSTIVGADAIMVVNNGRISEIGRHEELLAKGGEYAKMFNLQLNGISIDEGKI